MAHLLRFEPKNLTKNLASSIVGNTLVQGGRPAQWWRKQSSDFRTSFVRTMRTSMRNGEGVAQGIRRLVGGTIDGINVPGIMKTTRARAGALAATSMNAFTNNARVETFQQNTDVVKGTQQLSTLDNLTTDICIAYSGQAWDIETFQPIPPSVSPFNGGPPRHFNCRSTLVPVLKSFQELGLTDKQFAGFPQGTRASMDGQVPGETTFANFLSGKSKKFQDKLLGPSRAQLWRNGDITLTQLVDMRGNPMTLAQLEQKIGVPITRQDPDIGFKAAQKKQAEESAKKAAATRKIKEAARQKEIAELAKAEVEAEAAKVTLVTQRLETMLKAGNLPQDMLKLINNAGLPPSARADVVKLLSDKLKLRAASIDKRVDAAMKFAAQDTASVKHFDDAIAFTRKMRAGDESFLLRFDSAAKKAREKFINNITPLQADDVILLKKEGFTTLQIQTLKEGGLIENTVKQIRLARDASDDVVAILKDLNKQNVGPFKILDIISASDSILTKAGKKAADKIRKQAVAKASAGRKQMVDVLTKQLGMSSEDIKLIDVEILQITKKFGKKQLQNRAGELRTLFDLRKKEIALSGEAEVATLARVKGYLPKEAIQELDDAVRIFKKDPTSYSAKAIVQKVKTGAGNTNMARMRDIDEYLNARLNPKSIILADGAVVNFDNAIGNILKMHADDIDGKVIQQAVSRLTKGQSQAVDVRIKQTIFNRAGGKRWDELGKQPSFLGEERVTKKREQMNKAGDPNDIPFPKTPKIDELLAWYEENSGINGIARKDGLKQYLDRQWNGLKASIDGAWRQQLELGWDFGITKHKWELFIQKNPIPRWAVHMVNRYTGSFYDVLNAPLRFGSLDTKIIKTTQLMNKALDKFPKYRGTSYRGTRTSSNWNADIVEARYEVGKIITERGFSSSTTTAKASFSGDITFIYRSRGKGARIIGPASMSDSEREILFKAGTRFKVTKVQRPSANRIVVYLEEV